jgi:hypothetical protein
MKQAIRSYYFLFVFRLLGMMITSEVDAAFILLFSRLLCGTYGGEERCIQVFSGKRPLGRPRRRWEDNIKMDLREVGCGGADWVELAQDRDRWGGSCVYGDEPSGSIKCGEFLE